MHFGESIVDVAYNNPSITFVRYCWELMNFGDVILLYSNQIKLRVKAKANANLESKQTR